jgi:hypothetical protein
MEDLLFFIKNFIQKDRRERWIGFLTKDINVFFSKLSQIERHFNDNCRLVVMNSIYEVNKYTNENKIVDGNYYDEYTIGKKVTFPIVEMCQDSFIINKERKCAFYAHPEGWIWICKAI